MTSKPAVSVARSGGFWLAACVLLVLLPNIAWLAVCDGKYFERSLPYAAMCGLLPSLTVVLLLMAVFGRRLWIAMVLLLPFYFLVPIESAYILHYREPSWYAILATVIESNSAETRDFLGPLLWLGLLACAASGAFAVAAIVCVRRSRFVWTGRTRDWALVSSACVAAIFVLLASMAGLKSTKAFPTSGTSAAAATVAGKFPDWAVNLEPSFPVGVPLRVLHYLTEWNAMRDARDRLNSFRFGAVQVRPPQERQIYVLVIGETGRRDRWQLYGYERETNPELSRVRNLVQLDDLVTPAGESRDSVPIIVSRKPGTDHAAYFHERSISTAFAEAGFDTYWLSNQMPIGQYDSPIAVVAYDAAHVSFYSVADWGKPGTYDEVLLEPLRKAIHSSSRNLFIALHTMGSHANYALRYPDEFDRFKPSLKGVPDADYYDLSLKERIRNSYDNSIAYTDHFLAGVIRILDATQTAATMWYVSDHGEDFAEANCKLGGHGNGTVNDFRIPSVFWYSDEYAREFPAELEQMRMHSAMKLTTENIFESMVGMARLDFSDHDSSWSVFNPTWRPHRRMITGLSEMDFDSARVSTNCRVMVPGNDDS
jgi:glucan phosphoethanolaminetransferase (alkaline phosphatase superfamily)